MIFSFNYLVFQSNIDRERVTYWKDGNPTKEAIQLPDFLDLAININDGKNYSQIYDACHTYSFYLWDTLDQKVIPLLMKVNKEDYNNYKNSLNKEFLRVKANKSYYTMSKEEEKKTPSDEMSRIMGAYGFENPRTDLIPLLSKSLNDHINDDSFLGRVKTLFRR